MSKNNINKKVSKFLFKLKKENNLIIIFNEFSNSKTLNKIYKNKIPTIYLSYKLKILKHNNEYNIAGNLFDVTGIVYGFLICHLLNKIGTILDIAHLLFCKEKSLLPNIEN